MCDKVVNIYFFVLNSIPDQYKTQEMFDWVISKDPFMKYIAPIDIKLRKCVIKLLMIGWQHESHAWLAHYK